MIRVLILYQSVKSMWICTTIDNDFQQAFLSHKPCSFHFFWIVVNVPNPHVSLASHTLQSQEKEGLVTSRTTSCSGGMQ